MMKISSKRRRTQAQIKADKEAAEQKEVEADFPGAFDLPHFPVPFPERSA